MGAAMKYGRKTIDPTQSRIPARPTRRMENAPQRDEDPERRQTPWPPAPWPMSRGRASGPSSTHERRLLLRLGCATPKAGRNQTHRKGRIVGETTDINDKGHAPRRAGRMTTPY